MRNFVSAGIVALNLALCAVAAEWRPVEQPDLAAALAQAPALKMQDLADGPDTCWVGPEWWVPNPDGKSYDVALFYYPGYTGPHEVIIYDFGSGEMKRTSFFEFDRTRFAFHLRPIFLINGRLLMKPLGSKVGLFVYEPARNDLSFAGFPVGDQIAGDGGIAANDDGSMFYGIGQSRTGKRAAFYTVDTRTLKGQYLGAVEIEQPKMNWEYFKVAADGDWVYGAVGNTPWRLYGMNVKTRQGKLIAETEPIVGDHRTITVKALSDYPGCEVSITGLKGRKKDETLGFWLRNGELTPRGGEKAPPWVHEKFAAARPNFEIRYPKPPKGLERFRMPVDLDGKVRYWYRLSGALAEAAKAPAGEWRKIEFPVKLYPAPIRRMHPLPDGSIFAVTEGYGRAVTFHPRTGERRVLGPTMSVYSLCGYEDKVYLCGYPSSQVWIYDPAQPWTVGRSEDAPPTEERGEDDVRANAESNPRFGDYLKKYTDVHMPYGGAVPGADGRVYFGGKIIRIGNGGGLAWWDTKTQKAGGMKDPFSAYQVFWMCSADNGRYILCSTKPAPDDKNPDYTPPRGRLFVYDTTTQSMLHQVDADFWSVPGYIAEALPGKVIGYAATAEGGALYGFDPAAGQLLWTKPVPTRPTTGFAQIRRWSYSFAKGPDGFLWATMGDVLTRINPADAEVRVVGKMQEAMIVFHEGDVYVAGANKFRRIVGIPKVLPAAP